MDQDLLRQNINSIVPLTDSDWGTIAAVCVEREFKRGAFINQEGETNRFTNFIVSGSARVFHVDLQGQEHVVQLGIRGWWISDFASFITQKPGLLFTEALEPTRVMSISYDSLQQLYDAIPAFERFYRLLIQKAYASFQQRVLQNLSMDAETRYRNFVEAYPTLDQQIAQKHIASYLGMSAEFLSKIKKRMHEQRRNRPSPPTII
jgi:CRP-like cAMP-binding protein